MDNQKYQVEGLKWFHELELLSHPQVINNLKFNIFMVSKSIKEVELLIYRENKQILVLLELSWFGRKFNKRNIFNEVQDILSQLLPSFSFRVTEDPAIMNMAIERVKKALAGGKSESTSNTSDGSNGDQAKRANGSQPSAERTTQDTTSNTKEQTIASEGISNPVSIDNTSKE